MNCHDLTKPSRRYEELGRMDKYWLGFESSKLVTFSINGSVHHTYAVQHTNEMIDSIELLESKSGSS